MQEIVVGGLYRHFKGMLYYVIDIAIHSETNEPHVVYQQLYGERKTFVRPLVMFASEVDHENYPDVEQRDRFQLVNGWDEEQHLR